METVIDFIFLGSKSLWMETAALKLKDICPLESYGKPRQNIKSRDIFCQQKTSLFCIVKAMVFPVVMYGYEPWTIKKFENQKIDAFEF